MPTPNMVALWDATRREETAVHRHLHNGSDAVETDGIYPIENEVYGVNPELGSEEALIGHIECVIR